MADLIDRQMAIDALGEEPEVWEDDDEYGMGQRSEWCHIKKIIERLPSAQPEIKCVAQIKISRENLEELVAEKVDEIKHAQLEPHWIPCDWCKYNPPSSFDGKPCTICPAVGRGENE